jgi:glycosyltransferase involved in cell wall biosynthesis
MVKITNNEITNSGVTASICIPAYNGVKYIRQCIESALSQTFKDFEIIISDDSSTDGTEDICREYAKKDSRIRYFRHSKNMGGYLNFNYCLQKARGLYFTPLAHDDIMKNYFLEKTINYLSHHQECVLVSGDFEFIDNSSSHLSDLALYSTRANIPWEKRCQEFFKYRTTSDIYLLLYGSMRTDMIKKIFPNAFMPTLAKGAEMPVLCRIATEGEIVSLPRILRKFRLHDESDSKSEWLNINKKSQFIKRFVLFRNLWEIRLDQARVLIKSKYPLSQKLSIFLWVYKQYLQQLAKRFARFPKKFLR